MKVSKILTFTFAVIAIFVFSNCRRATDNGKIDGFWRIYEIQYLDDNSVVTPEYDEYIAIQLELIQLQSPGHSNYTGVITYNKGDEQMGVNFPNLSDAHLYPYGFTGPESTVRIERADSKHLVLRTPIAIVSCRKY